MHDPASARTVRAALGLGYPSAGAVVGLVVVFGQRPGGLSVAPAIKWRRPRQPTELPPRGGPRALCARQRETGRAAIKP